MGSTPKRDETPIRQHRVRVDGVGTVRERDAHSNGYREPGGKDIDANSGVALAIKYRTALIKHIKDRLNQVLDRLQLQLADGSFALLDDITEDIGKPSPDYRTERALADAERFESSWTSSVRICGSRS